jgi:tetratricopeptide (TPR) repeat protein
MGAVFCVSLAVLGSSCSTLPRISEPATAETQIIAETARQAQEEVALGKHKRALEIYSNAYDKNPQPGLKQVYSRLGEQIKTASDTAYQKGKFVEAGSDYRILLDSGIATRDFAGSLSFDNDYLRRQIEACSKALYGDRAHKIPGGKLDEVDSNLKRFSLLTATTRMSKTPSIPPPLSYSSSRKSSNPNKKAFLIVALLVFFSFGIHFQHCQVFYEFLSNALSIGQILELHTYFIVGLACFSILGMMLPFR